MHETEMMARFAMLVSAFVVISEKKTDKCLPLCMRCVIAMYRSPKQPMGSQANMRLLDLPGPNPPCCVFGEGYGPDAGTIEPFSKCPAMQTGPFLLCAHRQHALF